MQGTSCFSKHWIVGRASKTLSESSAATEVDSAIPFELTRRAVCLWWVVSGNTKMGRKFDGVYGLAETHIANTERNGIHQHQHYVATTHPLLFLYL